MVIILRGISGSGKSALAGLLTTGRTEAPISTPALDFVGKLFDRTSAPKIVVSADSFFMKEGEYTFDGKLLPMAHGLCLRKFSETICELPKKLVVVDNTNCSVLEVAPYAALATAFQHELHIVTLIGDPYLCWKRNKHSVPFKNILHQDMYLRKSFTEWPSWYSQEVFPVT